MPDENKNKSSKDKVIIILVVFLFITVVLWAYTSYRLVKIHQDIRAHRIYAIHHRPVSGTATTSTSTLLQP